MTTNSTGYSPTPKNYDDNMTKRETEIVFGRRHTDPDLSAPSGNVDTETYSNTDRLWSGSNGTIGLEPDPKLNKPRGVRGSDTPPAIDGGHVPTHVDPYAKHNVTYSTTGYNKFPEDWRASDSTRGIEAGWHTTTGPTFVTKAPATVATTYSGPTDKIPSGVATAIKHDAGKTDWSLMPFEAIEEINKVLDFGAKKYNEKVPGREGWNWAKGTGLGKSRVLSAIFRHLFAHARGEKLDPESGLSHIAHAGCGIIFILFYNLHPDKYTKE